MSDIIKQINEVAAFVSEKDIEWMVPKLLEFYEPKIRSLAINAYGFDAFKTESSVALRAFTERVKDELASALNTYIFKYEHWRSGRDIHLYLTKCMSTLSGRIKSENDNAKKCSVLICPGCKFNNKREYLIQFGDYWKCAECTAQLENMKKTLLSIADKSLIINIESKMRLYRSFEMHTRKGYKCPECERFIPESCNGDHGITCPFPDCFYFGKIEELEKMLHPVVQTKQFTFSLNGPLIANEKNNSSNEWISIIKEENNINPDLKIEANEGFSYEIQILREVIGQQLESVKRTNSAGTMLQKVLMYEAYSNMIDKFPEEMVSYLVHLKQSADFPLQSRIFQEYALLMQDALPYTIEKDGYKHDVVSLLDSKISLFEGISSFEASVRSDRTIPNKTKEQYMGGRKFKNYGPCFIGLILDIEDLDHDISIKDCVENYSFVQIKMNDTVSPGTKTLVKHYRIPSHYEMGALVYLQRIRKKIVDKVYFRINGQNRECKNFDSLVVKNNKGIQ